MERKVYKGRLKKGVWFVRPKATAKRHGTRYQIKAVGIRMDREQNLTNTGPMVSGTIAQVHAKAKV